MNTTCIFCKKEFKTQGLMIKHQVNPKSECCSKFELDEVYAKVTREYLKENWTIVRVVMNYQASFGGKKPRKISNLDAIRASFMAHTHFAGKRSAKELKQLRTVHQMTNVLFKKYPKKVLPFLNKNIKLVK